jgi:UDP-3-O-[3-hydroxymyristoyl] glucosamine N-acyltransferase
LKISSLASAIGARAVSGTAVLADHEVHAGAALDAATEGAVAFYADARYQGALETTGASAVVVDETTLEALGDRPFARLVHPNPAAAFARVLEVLHPEPAAEAGVHASAVVEAGAEVDPSASVMAQAFVGAGARVGARTRLHPGAYVGPGAVVGADCVLGPRSVVAAGCVLGDRVRLQPVAVVGSDGFGYALDTDEDGTPMHRKIPQVGIVRVEDDVEIGACACIDRATTGETVVGRGTKIDNLVQVGHNSTIGPLSILCGQVGLAGTSRIGTGVILAGQVGVAGHLEVGDGAKVGAQSGIGGDVPPGATVSGSPAIPHRVWLRAALAFKEIPEILKRVRRLEKKVGGD